tara:strand:+ start:1330 stop:2085 length:756 start_codon:yes stop_codon:yes gene_type:complete
MKKQKIILIIQARVDSTRFPKKVLAKINGKPLLWWVITRLKKVNCDEIIVSTTKRSIDKPIIEIARQCKVKYFEGKKYDVLDRFYQTAKKFQGNIIIRITADCPLIDYEIVNKVIEKFLQEKYEYIATDDNSFPKGLDTECFSINSLEKSWKNAKIKSEREHVTPYIWKNPKKFKILKIKNTKKLDNKMRLVVDHKEDLVVIKYIFSKLLHKNSNFLLKDVLSLYEKRPKKFDKNKKFLANEGYEISLKKD